MSMDKAIKNKLRNERAELQQRMLDVESSDDALFSNANGNLPTWKYCRDRIWAIDDIIKKGQEI